MKISQFWLQHLVRLSLSLAILLILLLNASGAINLAVISRLENFSYDLRLNMLMPRQLDNRIVIIDIDEKSLKEQGHWPWSRNKLADLVNTLFDDYQVNTMGFDVVFAEQDDSSGLKKLEEIKTRYFKLDANFDQTFKALKPTLDYDQLFANSLKNRNVVLGYVFLSDASQSGMLPPATFKAGGAKTENVEFIQALGFSANLDILQKNARAAGHFNPDPDEDGISRRVPMLIEYKGQMYESFSLAVARAALNVAKVEPGFAESLNEAQQGDLEWLKLGRHQVPVDAQLSALIPYRGVQGSFPYVSATDVLTKKVDAALLKNKIVLLGTTAAGLMDLRAAPVQNIYAGVEIHANMIAGILDNNIKQHPAYTAGAEFLMLFLIGVLLAVMLPILSPLWATFLTLFLTAVISLANLLVWQYANLVLPIASLLVMIASIYFVSMSYGYFVESRGKRQLAGLFGQYVPPELVNEMAKNPERISLEGESLEMTVLFADIRGFTTISEGLEPRQITQLINEYLTPMTQVIHQNRGTIDKYVGDAIVAFWGAPLADQYHAKHALKAALAMLEALKKVNQSFQIKGWPVINIGIGLSSGLMTVGNMGSAFRMAYTVMGDTVNLGSRLEGLTKKYRVQIIVSEVTKTQVPDFIYRELDVVRVKGKGKSVTIYEPIGELGQVDPLTQKHLKLYQEALNHYRTQQWDLAEMQFIQLQKSAPQCYLYEMYMQRIAYFRSNPPDKNWDGVFNFETK